MQQSGPQFNQAGKNQSTPGPKLNQPQNAYQNQRLFANKKPTIVSKLNKAQLGDLDDFEQPSNRQNKTAPAKPAPTPQSAASKDKDKGVKQKQRIVVPHDRLMRVLGKANSNVKLVQEITGALLELEEKKIPPHQDSSILIKGDSLEMTKHAFELLQSLINDPYADLSSLASRKPQPANKWTSSEPKSTPKQPNSYPNQAIGGGALIKPSDDRAQSQKPRNFAEVVAKQPSATTTNTLVSSLSNSSTALNKSTTSGVFNKSSNEPKPPSSSVNRRHNSVSPTSAKPVNSKPTQSSQTPAAKIAKAPAPAKPLAVSNANGHKKLLPDLPAASKSSSDHSSLKSAASSSSNHEHVQANKEQISSSVNKVNAHLVKLNSGSKKPISIVPPYAQNSHESTTTLPHLSQSEAADGKLQPKTKTNDQMSQFKSQLPPTDEAASAKLAETCSSLIQTSLSNPLMSKSVDLGASNSTGSSLISSTGSSSNVDNDLQANSSFLDLNSLGLLDGLGPLWPLSGESGNGESFGSAAAAASFENRASSQYFGANPLQLQAHKLISQANLIQGLSQSSGADEAAKMSGAKTKENVAAVGQPAASIGNKPIGYERHEKQIHNSSNVLTHSPSLNSQMNQLNSFNAGNGNGHGLSNGQPLNDFSCKFCFDFVCHLGLFKLIFIVPDFLIDVIFIIEK
jgi:hypothetical protein